MTSGGDGDKFVRAPYAEEFPFVLECKMIHRLAIGAHVQYIGEIVNVLAVDAIMDDDANLRVEALSPLVSAAPQRSYYSLGACIGKAYEIGTKENARFL